jgi:hypothetical protein
MSIDSDSIIQIARGIIVNSEVSPMLFISYKDEKGRDAQAICAFAVPSEHKFEAMTQVGQEFSKYECDAIAMISEAWVSTVDLKTNPDVDPHKIIPSKDPNRGEALVYAELEKSGVSKMKMFYIERSLDGPILTEQRGDDINSEPLLLAEFWKGYKEKRLDVLRDSIRNMKK